MSVRSVAIDRPASSKAEIQFLANDLNRIEGAQVSTAGLPLGIAPKALAVGEFLTIVITALLAKAAYLDYYLNSGSPTFTYALIALCMAGFTFVVYTQMGLYEVDIFSRPEINMGKLVAGLVISLLMVLGLLFALKEVGDLSRGWVFSWLGLIAVSIIMTRLVFGRWVRRWKESGLLLSRTAVIGTNDFALSIARRIRTMEGLSSAVDLYNCHDNDGDPRFVGGLRDLESLMNIRPYDRIVIAMPGGEIERIRAAVRSLGTYSTELLLCTDLGELPVVTNGARVLAGSRADVVHLVPLSEKSALLKRSFDLVIASASLLILSPLFALVALAIKLNSPGPVFFRQRRLGQNSTVFTIYKFRSMTVEQDGPIVPQATRNDQRVTGLGRILRATSIDELPQLINVILGQMSLVGPRPHAIAHDKQFDQQFDLFSRRRRVKPGITGWAQINGCRGETRTPEDIRERMEHDLNYIDNWSIWFDLEIIFRTLFVVLRGAY